MLKLQFQKYKNKKNGDFCIQIGGDLF